MEKKKEIVVLVVEDDKDQIRWAKAQLKRKGKIVFADNVESAKRKIRRYNPSIIISDLNLPQKRGEGPKYENGLKFVSEMIQKKKNVGVLSNFEHHIADIEKLNISRWDIFKVVRSLRARAVFDRSLFSFENFIEIASGKVISYEEAAKIGEKTMAQGETWMPIFPGVLNKKIKPLKPYKELFVRLKKRV